MTAEKINKYNEVRSRLTTFIADCLRGFGGQSVVSDSSLDPRKNMGAAAEKEAAEVFAIWKGCLD
ncbi:hypothetical protein [Bradyrhizobium sp. CCBAU 53380]|uniref:hypothetical protein n=1 Tax=Bradyrhizobium sp. CCBAU 53380 TaxID=1325117 RepID=UPI002303FB67|nr:hypothetical protein [Bradyrhizobium sp. CCBAU 53380]